VRTKNLWLDTKSKNRFYCESDGIRHHPTDRLHRRCLSVPDPKIIQLVNREIFTLHANDSRKLLSTFLPE